MVHLIQKLQTAVFNPETVPVLLANRLKSRLSYFILKTTAFPPETVNLYPTFKCNLKCEMCFERHTKVEYELDKKEWLRILSEIKNFHPRIHISGGEPFVYKGIMDIISQIKNLKLYLHITTNGTFLEEYVDELIRFEVNRIDISIDGPEVIHDKIRGISGTFNKITRGLERLKKIKRHQPIVKINSVINLTNPNTMQDIINIARYYEIKAVQFIYPLYLDAEAVESHRQFIFDKLGRNINYWKKADHYKPQSRDFSEIQSVINKLKKEKMVIYVFPEFNADQFKTYYNFPDEFCRIYKGRCRAMWNTATILPDGNVESCPDYILGDITKNRFLNIWNNSIMTELRKLILEKRFFSVCRACCFYYQ